MKKTLLLGVLFATSVLAKAQVEAGTFSLLPKVGVNVSRLTNSNLYTMVPHTTQAAELKSRLRVGVAAGIDADYRLLDMLSLSVGAMYSQQGCKYKNEEYLIKDMRIRLDYVNVPIMANFYVTPSLALKAGVQLGWIVYKSVKGNVWDTVVDTETGEAKEGYTQVKFDDIADTFGGTDFGIPVGISYDIDDVNLDLRYVFGLRGSSDALGGMKNQVIQLTLGYRIPL